MPTIKRYPNRKLYNTETKQYITLTQIVFDQEKKAGGLAPDSVLSGLIQAGGAA